MHETLKIHLLKGIHNHFSGLFSALQRIKAMSILDYFLSEIIIIFVYLWPFP